MRKIGKGYVRTIRDYELSRHKISKRQQRVLGKTQGGMAKYIRKMNMPVWRDHTKTQDFPYYREKKSIFSITQEIILVEI